MKTPLLIISDAPSASSGLGRICRDLALGIHHHLSDLYDVGTLGYGGPGDRKLPFPQYAIEGLNDFFIPAVKDVWQNFSEGRKGAVLTIWDASRMLWFGRPDNPDWLADREMRKWLLSRPFQKWIYAPMDAAGPKDMLCTANAECLYGFDRIIAYSEWAKKIIQNTFSEQDCRQRDLVAIPHGIHSTIFHPHQGMNRRAVFRADFGQELVFEENEKLIGIVATNQMRKDYGLAMEALEQVAKDVPIRIFIQIDTNERHWAIMKLLQDYNLMHRAIINNGIVSDETMAKLYSACDLTLGIGPEGFGFPIFESLACGTPVIAGNYGGHAEHMDEDSLIEPGMFRVEGIFNSVRPVYDPKKWAWKIKKSLTRSEDKNRFTLRKTLLPPRLDWKNLWSAEWEPWFRKQHQTVGATEPFLVRPSNIPGTGKAPEAHRMLKAVSQEAPSV
jgi:glycosyltransferase involved in cell wall biosynthesis